MKLRMQITKEHDIRFISHLEYVRTLERAIRRAQLPVSYSEGFNPHMKFSLASALGVGIVSYAEFLEMELAEPMEPENAVKKLSANLPRGIRILAADAVASGSTALMSQAGGASYRITLPYEDDLNEVVAGFNAAKSLPFKKLAPQKKEGFKEIDVKFYIPCIKAVHQKGKTILEFDCRITHDGSMKAVDLLNALNEYWHINLPVAKADIERLALYKTDEKGNKKNMLE
ncbi:MAG: TIGR03936 family radical SAM-associated protein [Phascolarctobacterium sp.]|nr:TIGR03936 family radical SAM-associated protein [Phascolarctobacterium sp.]